MKRRFFIILAMALLGALAPRALALAYSESPTFSLAGGRYVGIQTVEISCISGWYISYTTDGSDPVKRVDSSGYPSPQPTNPTGSRSVILKISQSRVIRAVAYWLAEDGYYRLSEEVVQSYAILEGAYKPTITPDGVIAGDSHVDVTISCKEGWQTAYVICDGGLPGSDVLIKYECGRYIPAEHLDGYDIFHVSSSVTNRVCISPSDGKTIVAIAYRKTADGLYRFSMIALRTYYYRASKPHGETPEVSVKTGELTEGYTQAIGIPVDINNNSSTQIVIQGAEIAYSDTGRFYLDNTPGQITLNEPDYVEGYCTIYPYLGLAAGEHTGTIDIYYNGEVMHLGFTFNVRAASPKLSLAPGTYIGTQQVSLSTTTQDATIKYTTDGRNPNHYGEPYTGPITVSESTTIRASAYLNASPRNQSLYSRVVQATYTIIIPVSHTLELTAPQFDKAAADYVQPETKPLILASTGNSDATVTSVGFLEGGNAFILNKTDGAVIAAGSTDNTTYTVQPAAGLAPGTYTAIVAAAYDDGETAVAALSFTVDKPLYQITVYVPEEERGLGDVTILGSDRVHAGSRVNFTAGINNDYYDDYQLIDVVVSDMVGNRIEVDYWGGFVMPASPVTLTPVFNPLLPITIELGNTVNLMGIQTDSHAWGADNARAAAGETVRMDPMSCDGEYTIASVTVTAQDGSPVPCARYREYLADVDFTETGWQFVMPDMPVTVRFVMVPVFGEADFVLPTGLAIIEANAFQGDALISAVDAGHCVLIGAEAFKNCANLSQIRLPQSCWIDPCAFDDCGTVYVFAPAGGNTETYCKSNDNPCVFVEETGD